MLLLVSGCSYGIHVPPVDAPWHPPVEDTGDPAETITDPTPPIDSTDTTDTTETTDTAETAAEAVYEAYFDIGVVQQIHLELTDDALSDLRRDPFTYVHGNVVIGETRLDDVGIRLKGSSSYQDLSGKAAFKVRFNEYVDQHYGSLERITLNNMVGDPTQGKEIVGYHVFRAGGVAAPRANYAQVWVNDSYYGLYTNLESMDEHLLKHWYDDNDGDLWEGNDNADFTRRGVDNFEIVSGKGDRTQLDAAASAVRGASDFYADAGVVLDMDQYLDFWAYTLAIGNGDGYPYHLNDFFVYQDPGDGRFDFFTWGIDESWDPYLQWSYAGGQVGTQCLDDRTCEDLLKDHTAAALDVYEGLDLPTFAADLEALTDPLLADETRSPWSAADVRAARAGFLDTLPAWPDDLRRQMGL